MRILSVYHPLHDFSEERIRIETPRTIIDWIPTLTCTTRRKLYITTHEHPVELAGVNLAGRNHVCAFLNTIDEEDRVLGSFYKDGLDRGEKAAHIVDPENREERIHVQKMIDSGQLDVLPWTDTYVRNHWFDQDAMLATVEELIQLAADGGYPLTRLVGHHMDWLFLDKPAIYNLVP